MFRSANRDRCTAAHCHSMLRGFTLIELLVVISLIGMLVSLLMPAISSVRATARRTGCLSNLRQIGLAMEQYVDVHKRFPKAAQLPSVSPELPAISDLFGRFAEENNALFACPADNEYYAKEGLSYEYPSFRLADKTRRELKKDRPLDTIWVAFDYDHFHGPEATEGARNVLFADNHVSSF